MADILVKHLKERSEEHSALATLYNQWGYDEKLIPKALQTVGNLFPHYSRHDESHSKQILINIERLLGDNIKLLTATDTWLLLEAAYWHDIGMVVPQKDLENAIKNPAFNIYVEGIRNSPRHDLHKFSLTFNAGDLSKCFCGADTPIEALDKFRQLMAEWFRQSHTARSNAIVQAPWASVGINSPRTELIPARLYRLLGNICQMHGVPFAELMSHDKGLPFREAGLAQEDCHPRFVACLLRMGDLLDMDDNRFCPVMQRIAGENRPHLSKAHEDKHAALRHLRLDRERIEVSAECETIEGYIETFKWFDWLKKEIQDQMSHWQEIVPNRELGLLPTLGEISVRLGGELQILKPGERPQFSVDGAKAIELLQGSNLYKTRFACIRELLQNAVDATLLRLWLAKKDNLSTSELNRPDEKLILDELKEWPIVVNLTEIEESTSNDSDMAVWMLRIIDKGTGISRVDLEHMLRIGGSQRNIQRQTLIKSMPEWMKPSGAFGIGFQSAFLICDAVTLTTKSIFTNETLEVKMHSPTGPNDGMVTIRVIPSDISREYGAVVEMKIILDKISKNWSYNFGDNISIKSQFLKGVDPVLDRTFPYEAAELADNIVEFSQYSLLPVQASLCATNDKFNIEINTDAPIAEDVIYRWRYIKIDEHEFKFRYKPVLNIYHNNFKTWYRGQPFECKNIFFPCVEINIDLMSGKAGAWLTANRDSIISQARETLKSIILLALEKSVEEDIKNSTLDLNAKEVSFFLNNMSLYYPEKWEFFAKKSDSAWLGLQSGGSGMPYSEFFKKPYFFVKEKSHLNKNIKSLDSDCGFEVEDRNLLSLLVKAWLEKPTQYISISESYDLKRSDSSQLSSLEEKEIIKSLDFIEIDKYRLLYNFSTVNGDLYTQGALANRLIGVLQECVGNSRFILPCADDRWNRLFIKSGVSVRARSIFQIPVRSCGNILLPYLYLDFQRNPVGRIQCTPEQIEKICNWVRPNLIYPISVSEVRKLYDDLINYIDNDVMKPTCHWEKWVELRQL